MSNIDILIREKYDIPEDQDTVEFCEEHGLDYSEELYKVYRVLSLKGGM